MEIISHHTHRRVVNKQSRVAWLKSHIKDANAFNVNSRPPLTFSKLVSCIRVQLFKAHTILSMTSLVLMFKIQSHLVSLSKGSGSLKQHLWNILLCINHWISVLAKGLEILFYCNLIPGVKISNSKLIWKSCQLSLFPCNAAVRMSEQPFKGFQCPFQQQTNHKFLKTLKVSMALSKLIFDFISFKTNWKLFLVLKDMFPKMLIIILNTSYLESLKVI